LRLASETFAHCGSTSYSTLHLAEPVMQRLGLVSWCVSIGVVIGMAGCDDDIHTNVNSARPDASPDAAVDAGLRSNDAPVPQLEGDASVHDESRALDADSNPEGNGNQAHEAGIQPDVSISPTTDWDGATETRASTASASHATETSDGVEWETGHAPETSQTTQSSRPDSDAGAETSRPTNTPSINLDSGSSDVGSDAGSSDSMPVDADHAATDGQASGDAAGTGATSIPSGCGSVPEAGTCVGDILHFCEAGDLHSVDCAASGERCEIRLLPELGASCISDLDAAMMDAATVDAAADAGRQPPDAGRQPPDVSGCSEVELSPALWSVAYVDSSEPSNPPEFAVDGDLGTYFQTGSSAGPHELIVDLGLERVLLGLTYVARQDSAKNGTIADFELYASSDGVDWFEPVMEATFRNTKIPQDVRFQPVTARYVRLLVLSSQDNESVATIAELELLAARCDGDPEEPPKPPFRPTSVAPYLDGAFPTSDPLTSGQEPPGLLSQTGAFSQLEPLVAGPALIPYDVNQPLWSDHALKSRFIVLANDGAFDQGTEHVTFDSVQPWQFPAGTVFVKHFELALSEMDASARTKLETRFLVVAENGSVYGLTYRWNDAGTEAYLLSSGDTRTLQIETSEGTRTQTWTFPERVDCDHCHNSVASFVLGVNAWQLNLEREYPNGSRDNQLERLRSLGVFSNPYPDGAHTTMAHAVSVGDADAPTEARLKSYMAANCSHCHRPGAVASQFDARFEVPLDDVIGVPTQVETSTTEVLVAPGFPEQSEIFQRDNSLGEYGMPPVGKAIVDKQYTDLLRAWIGSLGD
jgi:hypothetical protein